MRAARFLLPGSLLLAAIATPSAILAQEGTPAPNMTLPRCTTAPRNLDQMVALWFEASGTPVATPAPAAPYADVDALPAGEPVDDATQQAITETTQELFSCMEIAGQYARGFNLMTDRLATQMGPDLTNPDQDTPGEVRSLLEGQMAATPVAGEQTLANLPLLVGPRKARLLEDGRAGAIWSLGGDRVFFIYQKQDDGRWLIDDIVDILETAGTPEATPAA
jgi:hypothetical protein